MAYLLTVGWFVSLLPKLIILPFLVTVQLSDHVFNWIDYIITTSVLLPVIIIFIKKSREPFTLEGRGIPLFKVYPEYEEPINNYLQQLGIIKRVDFFVNDNYDINAYAVGNAKYGIVSLNKGLFVSSINKDIILAVVCHELHHVKNWSITLINYEIHNLIKSVYQKLQRVDEKANNSKISKLFTLNTLTSLWIFCSFMFLFLVSISFNLYRILIDEILADKLAIDLTKSRKFAKLFREDKQNVLGEFDDIIFNSHLPSIMRYKIINKYYYFKYIRKDWRRSRAIVISILISVTGTLYMVNKSLQYTSKLGDVIINMATKKWTELFNGNTHLALITFFAIITGGCVAWNIVKIVRAFRLNKVWIEKLRLITISLFFLSLCFLCIVAIFPKLKFLAIPPLMLMIIMILITKIYEKIIKRKLKDF
ncbi:M48 family metalloprotease [Brevibacillus brevis]|uniref:M48 family metalloprotease n=1 Tax=Brevibacillus brevis TaxID=1393 RepID=UPI000AB263AB|nr:M48 family metalloprotease [Brevibacillus brevis]